MRSVVPACLCVYIATVDSSSLPLIVIIALAAGVGGAILTALIVVICSVVLCKWRFAIYTYEIEVTMRCCWARWPLRRG